MCFLLHRESLIDVLFIAQRVVDRCRHRDSGITNADRRRAWPSRPRSTHSSDEGIWPCFVFCAVNFSNSVENLKSVETLQLIFLSDVRNFF